MNSLASPRGLDFESLVHEHQGMVYHVALRVLRDSAGAEDVAQQVFLRLFQERGIPRGVTSPRAYVARAAANAALDALKARERRSSHEQKATPRRSTPMSPTDAVLQAEVRAAVDELPVEQRLAVVLHFFQGLTHAEVAESLEVPAGTVASRIHAAVGRLREALAGAGVLLVAGALEGALEAAESDPVPSELTEKLLRIPLLPPPAPIAPAVAPAGGPGEAGAGGAVATALASAMTGPFAIALVVLATLGIALLAAVRLAQPAPTRTSSTSSGPNLPTLATYSTPPSPPNDTPEPPMRHDPVVEPPAATDGELVTIDGFLVRWEDGTLHVDDVPIAALQTEATAPVVLEPESEKAFEGIPLGGTSLSAHLTEPRSLGDAPRVYVRLTGTVRHEDAKTKTDFFGLGTSWFTTREFVAVDYLTDGWLAAWRQARRGLWNIDYVLRQPPAWGRREDVIAEAQKTLHAVEGMRRMRETEAVPAGVLNLGYDPLFRRETERGLLRQLWTVTSPYGITPVGVPAYPTAEELRKAFFEARDQAEFRATILARYGADALDGWVSFIDQGRASASMVSYGLRGVAEVWSPEEFQEVQERARSIPENFEKETLPEHPEYEKHRARVAAAGLGVEGLGAIDRQTWLITEGVKVVSVTQGSRAERAGFRVGDVVWRVHVRNELEKAPEDKVEPHYPANPVNFGALLGRAEGLDAVTLDVLRDGECVQVVLPLK